MTMSRTVACHWRTRLIPFRVTSTSARFLCCMWFSGYSQQVSSMIDPLSSRVTPMARELASTQTASSFPLMHQSPRMGLSCFTLSVVLVIIYLGNIVSLVIPSWHNRSHEMLHGCCCHSKPAAYGKMAYQFPTYGEGAPMSDHWQDFWDVTTSPPAKFFFVTTDM